MTDRLGYLHGNDITFKIAGHSLPQVTEIGALNDSENETVTIATLEATKAFTFSGKPTEATVEISLVWQPGLMGHDEVFLALDDKQSRAFEIIFPEVTIVKNVRFGSGSLARDVKAAVSAAGVVSFTPLGQASFLPGSDGRIQEGMALVIGGTYYPISSVTDGDDGVLTSSKKTTVSASVFTIVQPQLTISLSGTVTKASQVIQSGTFTQLDISIAQSGKASHQAKLS